MRELGPERLTLVLWYATGEPHGYWVNGRGRWERGRGVVRLSHDALAHYAPWIARRKAEPLD